MRLDDTTTRTSWAPIDTSLRTRRPASRLDQARKVADVLGNFLAGAAVGFLATLVTGSIVLALIVGCATGATYLFLRMRFGDRLDTGLELSADQVAARARARANGYFGTGVG